MRRPVPIATLLALVVVGAACTTSRPPPDAASPAPSATLSPSPSPIPVEPLAWTSCGAPFECATLTVPLDYAHPDGGTIHIATIRLPALAGGTRIGSLLLNPGGPGGSGIEFLRNDASLFTGLRGRFDLVSFDPRGVGQSDPVRCVGGPFLDRYLGTDPTPDDAAERKELIDLSRTFADDCGQRAARLLPFVGTEEAARDMDVLRAALGDDRLTYLGLSYGTFLGATYADLFPERVRALALDAAVDPTVSILEMARDQAIAFEKNLQAFLSDCANAPNCPFGGTDPAQALDDLLARLDRSPLTVGARTVGPGLATFGILAAMYSPNAWPTLQGALGLAERGDGSSLLSLADSYSERQPDGSYPNLFDANNAVNCLDRPAPRDVASYDRAVHQVEGTAPHFGGLAIYGSIVCAFWPVPSRQPHTLVAHGAPPILVVGATDDPATPYDWAQSLADQLERGVLLTRVGEGHVSYTKSPCVVQAINTYLIDLTLPAAGTSCR